MAIARDESTAEIVYLPCADERVHEVTVQQIDASPAGVISGPVLWRIESIRGEELDELTIGELPVGFEVIVALTQPLPQDEDLWVSLRTSKHESMDVEVRLSELRADDVQSDDGTMPREDFEAQRSSC